MSSGSTVLPPRTRVDCGFFFRGPSRLLGSPSGRGLAREFKSTPLPTNDFQPKNWLMMIIMA